MDSIARGLQWAEDNEGKVWLYLIGFVAWYVTPALVGALFMLLGAAYVIALTFGVGSGKRVGKRSVG